VIFRIVGIGGVQSEAERICCMPFWEVCEMNIVPDQAVPTKGSRKNKFAILGVETPGWQGAKTQKYLDIPSFRNAARRDASVSKMRSYF
jgi:hypothetical protein